MIMIPKENIKRLCFLLLGIESLFESLRFDYSLQKGEQQIKEIYSYHHYSLVNMDHDELSRRILYIVVIVVLPCCILVTLKICYKIFSKYRHKFEPMHIFMINFFVSVLLYLSSLEMNGIRTTLLPTSETCWHFSINLLTSFYHSLSIIIMQMDRFVAVIWAIHYKRLVNNTTSIAAICVCIFIAAIIVFAATLLDPT